MNKKINIMNDNFIKWQIEVFFIGGFLGFCFKKIRIILVRNVNKM